jgi:hypothetical protein
MSLKNPVTTPGIEPETIRLVAQRIKHYATPGPLNIMYIWILQSMNNLKHVSEPFLINFYQILKLKFPEDFTGL